MLTNGELRGKRCYKCGDKAMGRATGMPSGNVIWLCTKHAVELAQFGADHAVPVIWDCEGHITRINSANSFCDN